MQYGFHSFKYHLLQKSDRHPAVCYSMVRHRTNIEHNSTVPVVTQGEFSGLMNRKDEPEV